MQGPNNLHEYTGLYWSFGDPDSYKSCSEVKILKKKMECYFHGYGAMISMENLENQTFTSKNHILGLE